MGKELPSEQAVEWIVSGPPGSEVTIVVESEKGGKCTQTVTLN
jgi:hypothetical protein